jgi:poly(3-hydroxybutyrate) depolymerase
MRRRLLFFAPTLLFILFFIVFGSNAHAGYRLPALSVGPTDVTVSGVSAGGFMAVQMHVAHSEEISGAGVVAGGIYWCAEGNPYLTGNPCMLAPWLINVGIRTQKAVWEAQHGRIDPLSNLRRGRIYIYGSPIDPVINVASSTKLDEFYSAFLDKSQIVHRHNVLSAHGFPTASYGAPCGPGGYPWLLNCGVDVAGEILTQMYGRLNEPTVDSPEHLHAFDQTDFSGVASGMAGSGFVYIPAGCQGDAASDCKLHIALHGCGMSPLQIGDAFTAHAGYNRWAEANNIVILYPTVATTMANPLACWDWYGYTGYNYVNKLGPQIRALQSMIERLTSRPEPRSSDLH